MKTIFIFIAIFFNFNIIVTPIQANSYVRAGNNAYPLAEIPFLCDLKKLELHIDELEAKGRMGDEDAERRAHDFKWLLYKEKRARYELEMANDTFQYNMKKFKENISFKKEDDSSLDYLSSMQDIQGDFRDRLIEAKSHSVCPEFKKKIDRLIKTTTNRMNQIEAQYAEVQKRLFEKERRVRSKCNYIIGNWRWFNGASVNCGEGRCTASNGFSASWTCLDPEVGQVEINWTGPNGDTFQDKVIVNKRNLSGTNQLGNSVSATRK